jgi:homocysteine S-methyltransferase
MAALPFPDFLQHHACILGEGAIIERLRRQPGTVLDPHLVNSAFIYDPLKRAALATLYRQYLAIGRDHDLPMMLTAPTWRANAENIAAAGCGGLEVNADNVRLLQELRVATGAYAAKVVIGGLIGCRGDAYQPGEALATDEARVFHFWQAERLAAAGVDFLYGITLPALSEALGLAAAMAATGRPYVVSFIVRPAGTLLDGTPLKTALARIDAAAPRGFFYQLHPSRFRPGRPLPPRQLLATRPAAGRRPSGQRRRPQPRGARRAGPGGRVGTRGFCAGHADPAPGPRPENPGRLLWHRRPAHPPPRGATGRADLSPPAWPGDFPGEHLRGADLSPTISP